MLAMSPRRGDPGWTRALALAELAGRRFDLLVIGGGIIGAGIAAHAARAGLAVALVDAGDFGGATSSASFEAHPLGLRYLRLGDVRLVREAHHERRLLTNVVAPHLVRRVQFLLPLYLGGPSRPSFVQTGIVVYSALASRRTRRSRVRCQESRVAGERFRRMTRASRTPSPGTGSGFGCSQCPVSATRT
jgi:glycerol-3-phosphate dehydrogenase